VHISVVSLGVVVFSALTIASPSGARPLEESEEF
jgi:hypothetical protein